MNEKEVVALMKSSKSAAEWDLNCDKVKSLCGGYPPFWYGAIILSGVAAKTAANFGGSTDIKITTMSHEDEIDPHPPTYPQMYENHQAFEPF